jgi:thioredoxin-related protein
MRNISLRLGISFLLCLFFSPLFAQNYDKENDNQIGDTAINFTFVNENGLQDLYSLIESQGTNVLVVFYSPECEDCQALKKKMSKSKKLNSLIAENKLTILAVAPEVEEKLWQEHKSQVPENWINSYCEDCEPITKSYIWTVPTLFLISKDKIILNRDFKHRERNKYN